MVAAIALGGAAGAVIRYLLAVRVYSLLGIDLPYGTFTINLLGTLALGVVLGLVEERGAFGPEVRSFLTIGLLGGMTTFSTLSYEVWDLLRSGDVIAGFGYGLGSLIAGYVAFAAGHTLVRALEA